MGDELAVLGAGFVMPAGSRLAEHVAGLAGGDGVFAVEGKRRLLGEAGALPLVVKRDGAEPFVVVEGARDGRLVAGGAELGGLVERPHHRLGMAIEMGQDLRVGDGPGDGRALFIDQHGRDSHDIAAGSDGVGGLDGVAGRAGDALVLKGPLLRHALRKVAAEAAPRGCGSLRSGARTARPSRR